MTTKPWPPEAINNDHFWQYKAKAMLCDLEEALFPSISIQFIHPAIFEDPACSSQYSSGGKSKNLVGTKYLIKGFFIAKGFASISAPHFFGGRGGEGEALPPCLPTALLRRPYYVPTLLDHDYSNSLQFAWRWLTGHLIVTKQSTV